MCNNFRIQIDWEHVNWCHKEKKIEFESFDRKVATAQLDKVVDSLSESNDVFL